MTTVPMCSSFRACLVLLLLAFALAACDTEIQLQPTPIASTGADQSALVGAQVVLDGEGSHVPGLRDTRPDSATWTIVVAPQAGDGEVAAVIEDPSSLLATMTVDAPGLFVVRLDVSHEGSHGKPAYLNVHAREVLTPPIALAGPDQVADPGELVFLDGSGSHSADGSALSFAWTQVFGPSVTLSDTSSVAPSFTAPRPAGELGFALVVTDLRGLSSPPDQVTVTVRSLPPVADAGDSVTAGELDSMVLDGSGSYDPNDGPPLSFSWQQELSAGDPPGILQEEESATPTFIAPRVSETVDLTLVLTVENAEGETSTDTVTVTVERTIVDLGIEQEPPAMTFVNEPFTMVVEVLNIDGELETRADDSITLSLTGGSDGAALTGTLTRPAIAGRAIFDDLAVDTVGQGYRVHAESPLLQSTQSISFDIAASTVATLVVTSQPESTTAGEAFSVTVQALDEDDLLAFAFNGLVTLEVHSGPEGGAVAGTTSVLAQGGIAVFDAAWLNRSGVYVLDAIAAQGATGRCDPISVSAGPAARLAFRDLPASVLAAETFSAEVEIQDAYGNPNEAWGEEVSIAIDSAPTGGALSGAVASAPTTGIVTFTGLSLDRTGEYVLSASSGALDIGLSDPLLVLPGAPVDLVLVEEPSSLSAGEHFDLVAEVRDAEGNRVDDYTGPVTQAMTESPPGATLSGGDQVDAVDGVASFQGLWVDLVGDYVFTVSAPDLGPDSTASIAVGAGAAAQVSVTGQPQDAVGAGALFTVEAQIEDAFGNLVPAWTDDLSIAIHLAPPGGGQLSGTLVVPAQDGAAVFDAISLNRVGDYLLEVSSGALSPGITETITIIPGDAHRLFFSAAPASVVAGNDFSLEVMAQDEEGNLVPGFEGEVEISTLSAPSGGALIGAAPVAAGGGIAHFEALHVEVAGDYVFEATAASLVPAQTGTMRAEHAEPAALFVVTAPTTLTAGQLFALSVEARDAFGNPATSYTGGIVIAPASGPGPLFGIVSRAPTEGAATFDNLYLEQAGDYVIEATGGGLIPGQSETITVTAAGATSLVFTTQPPPAVTTGNEFTVAVRAHDGFGNPDLSFTGTVTIDIDSGHNPAGGTLSGIKVRDAENGEATFPGLSIEQIGTGYRLMAESTGLTGVLSGRFAVTIAPTRLVITVQPPDPATLGTTFTIVAQAQDDLGNLATGYDGTVTLSLVSPPSPADASILGPTTRLASNGEVVFTGVTLDRPGIYVLRVSDDTTPLAGDDTMPFVYRYFEGGTGAAADPYRITNVFQLQAIWLYLDAHFVLVGDIDASVTTTWVDYHGADGFLPIGVDGDRFTGTFNGRGHIITGLHINRPSLNAVGLFGFAGAGSLIENVCVKDVDIVGGNQVGALVGYGRPAVIRRACATGSVTGGSQVGGLVGYLRDDASSVTNSYARTTVNYGGSEVGGFIGRKRNSNQVDRCYSTGAVVGTGTDNVGGFIGRHDGPTTNSFWDMESSGRSTSNGGTGKTTAEMKDVRTFTSVAFSAGLGSAWDFVESPYDDSGSADIWDIDDAGVIAEGYPHLRMFQGEWKYRKEIQIAHTNVQGSLRNFPVLISFGADQDLAARARSDGADLRFASADGTSLDFEIESFDDATGTLTAWVRIPSLSSTVDTIFYMYYGNETAFDGQYPPGVWDRRFAGVWHLHDQLWDSTVNENDGANNGSTNAAGLIADAQGFDGSSSRIDIAHDESLAAGFGLTMEAWVNLTDSASDQKVLAKSNIGDGYVLGVTGGALYPEIWDSSGARFSFQSGTVPSNAWTHIAVTWTTGGDIVGYVNGSEVHRMSAGTVDIAPTTRFLRIGCDSWGDCNHPTDGAIDEVRISNRARSANWLQTSVANQSSPASFLAFGIEEEL